MTEDRNSALIWLTLTGIIYLFFSLIFSENIQRNPFLTLTFLSNLILGVFVVFRLKFRSLVGFEWIYPASYAGLGFTVTFTAYLASYPKPVIDLGWTIFLAMILKIIVDLLGFSVEIEVSG